MLLLDLRFASYGCMDNRVINLGGVSFNETSPILDSNLRCATLLPNTEDAGLYIKDTNLNNGFFGSNNCTIYFKYKIDKRNVKSYMPILSTRNSTEDDTRDILSIEEGKYFQFKFNDLSMIYSTPVDWSFDNRWHTFTFTKYIHRWSRYCYFYIDGIKVCPALNISGTFQSGDELLIGHSVLSGNEYNHKVFTAGGLSIDNFVITNDIVYTKDFVPPNLYFSGTDSISNYFLYDESNSIENSERYTVKELERQIHYGTYYFNRNQLDYLPRRCKLNWQQVNSSWNKSYKNYTIKHDRDVTIIEITGIEFEMNFYTNENCYLEGNVYKLYKEGIIEQIFMLFLDEVFIPLSQIEIRRSDKYTTLFFPNRDAELNPRVKSLEIVTIPFRVIYEENKGERADLNPLYAFNNEGKFDYSSASVFYYIDPNHCLKGTSGQGIIHQTGIQDQIYEDPNSTSDNTNNYMKYVWRYGELQAKYYMGDSAVMYFMAWDNGYIKPGDKVLLYKNTTLVDPSLYRVVGYDLLQFYNYKKMKIKSTDLFTMQIITDTAGTDLHLFQDLADMEFAWVTATEDNQSTFEIPKISVTDGFDFHKFIVFRGSVSMEGENRYIIDIKKNTLTLTNPVDFVPIGASLLFVYARTKRANAYGKLHPKPYFFYAKTYNHNGVSMIQLPEDKKNGFVFNMENTMLFIQDVFISPQRYRIDNGTLTFVQVGDTFPNNKSCILVCFKMLSDLEDPTTMEDTIKKEQLDKGNRFFLYDLNIDKRYQITLDNFVCFDEQGRYIPDLYGKVYPMNIIKYLRTSRPAERVPRYLTCVYFSDSLENKANCIYPDNTTYIKDYITMKESMYELDPLFDDFMKRFDYHHKQDLQYGENLSNALDYIMTYNQNRMDKVYEDHATTARYRLDTKWFKSNMKRQIDGTYTLDLFVNPFFKSTEYREYCIIFINGVYCLWNKNTTYNGNIATLHMYSSTSISDTDRIDLIRFYKHNPLLEELTNTCNSGKRASRSIASIIRVGKLYTLNINSTIAVSLPYSTEFNATINVEYKHPTQIKNGFEKDAFNAILKVPYRFSKDAINASITVSDVKIGIPDPGPSIAGSKPEYYEIYSRITVV